MEPVNTLESKTKFALKPDAQAFDEIKLKVVPRFKFSGLSGSEWRISVKYEFFRNEKLIVEGFAGHDMERAIALLYSRYCEATDNGNGYFASDGYHCDQEGCNEVGKYLYKIKQDYCTGYGNCGQKKDSYTGYHRLFCEAHKKRGDSDLCDNDGNYELVKVIESPLP